MKQNTKICLFTFNSKRRYELITKKVLPVRKVTYNIIIFVFTIQFNKPRVMPWWNVEFKSMITWWTNDLQLVARSCSESDYNHDCFNTLLSAVNALRMDKDIIDYFSNNWLYLAQYLIIYKAKRVWHSHIKISSWESVHNSS